MICTGIEYYGEEEIIKKEKKTQINKKACIINNITCFCSNSGDIFTKDSKSYTTGTGCQRTCK